MRETKSKVIGIITICLIITCVCGLLARAVLSKQDEPVNTATTNAEVITNEAPAVSINTKDIPETAATGNPFAGRYVTYQGLTRIETDGTTLLINPEDNNEDVYIEFVVTEDDKELYSSELVQAGKCLDVDFREFISSGEHKITVIMNPYLLYEGEYMKCPVNNAQELTVTM